MEEQTKQSGATIAALMAVIEEMRSTGPGEKAWRFNAAVIAEYRASGGKSLGELPPESTVLITMTGARSGLQRTVPIGVQEIDGRLVIVASMGGLPRHPQWYHNLLAHPIVTVEWLGQTFRAEAVVTEGEDRAQLFAQLNEAYRAQQSQTTRQFPIIELRRINEA